jgi:hypothetical protein
MAYFFFGERVNVFKAMARPWHRSNVENHVRIQNRIRVGIDDGSTSSTILAKFILTDKVWLQENMLCLLIF